MICKFYHDECPVVDCELKDTPDRCQFHEQMIRKYPDSEIDVNGFLNEK